MVIVVINSHLLAVDQHYNHRPLINAVGVGVAQHPFFLDRIPAHRGEKNKTQVQKDAVQSAPKVAPLFRQEWLQSAKLMARHKMHVQFRIETLMNKKIMLILTMNMKIIRETLMIVT